MRSILIICSCACVAVVLTEVAGLAYLWQQGNLTSDNIRDVRQILTGVVAAEKKEADEAQAGVPLVSLEEVAEKRAVKVLDLDKREGELMVLKSMATDRSSDLDAEQLAFRAQRKEFEDRLAQLKATETSAATEQARGVLLALPPKDAVEKLMQLSVNDDVVLLKGMPENIIARILKEFTTTPDQIKRGREIFEAINRGEPTAPMLHDAEKRFATGVNDGSGTEAPAANQPAATAPNNRTSAAPNQTKAAVNRPIYTPAETLFR